MRDDQPLPDEDLDGLFAALSGYQGLLLAVSGGADSMALMHLVVRWQRSRPEPRAMTKAVTVDHGLRPGSAAEADWVAEQARALGLAHETVRWEGIKPASGVQEAARAARYRLLSEYLLRFGGLRSAVVTAHHCDDQAETVLMRLARGSGIDGLGGMAPARRLEAHGVGHVLRPFLDVPKPRLVATLRARGLPWIADPSNHEPAFERVRVRSAGAALERIGLSNPMIALSAKRLRRAAEALAAAADELAVAVRLDVHGGAFASFDIASFRSAPEELRLRLLSRVLGAFGGRHRPPRLARVEDLLARLASEDRGTHTLGGCTLVSDEREIQAFREPGRKGLPELTLIPGSGAIWDNRFRVRLAEAAPAPLMVRALGGSAYATLRRSLDTSFRLPTRAATTLPSFWRGDDLMAVPHLVTAGGSAGTPSAHRLCHAEFVW